jgi:hypothetical protein
MCFADSRPISLNLDFALSTSTSSAYQKLFMDISIFRIDIKRSTTSMTHTLLFGAVTVGTGCILLFYYNFGGWIAILIGATFFIAGTIGLIAETIGSQDNKLRVTITQTGVSARELGEYEILWQQIETARLEHIPRGGNFIVFELNDGKTLRFYADGLMVSAYTILQIIREKLMYPPQDSL